MLIAALTLALMALGAFADGRHHLELALAVGALTILLQVWLAPANLPLWVRNTGWIALGLFAIDSVIMAGTPMPPSEPGLVIPHAIVAPLFFAALTVIAFYTWVDWINPNEQIDYSAQPLLPTAALAAPVLVILQIAMGAAYRHKIFSVMPHMAGAMLVTLVLLVMCVVLLQTFPEHPTLRPLAIAGMSALLLQVTLGIAAFVMRLLDFDSSPGFPYLASAHICAGALVLAASVLLCIEVRRCGLSSGRS
jgi:heme A synthase